MSSRVSLKFNLEDIENVIREAGKPIHHCPRCGSILIDRQDELKLLEKKEIYQSQMYGSIPLEAFGCTNYYCPYMDHPIDKTMVENEVKTKKLEKKIDKNTTEIKKLKDEVNKLQAKIKKLEAKAE